MTTAYVRFLHTHKISHGELFREVDEFYLLFIYLLKNSTNYFIGGSKMECHALMDQILIKLL